MTPRTALVQFSTGVGSAFVAHLAVENYGVDNVVLMTADTLVEDEDNWRFADEVWRALGQPLWVKLTVGKDPMQIGRDARCVPNNRMAVCSRMLKRDPIRTYMDNGFDVESSVVQLGFDWTEEHRLIKARPHWEPWEVECPLMDTSITKAGMLEWFNDRGIKTPRLYDYGFSHANCGGGCVRGGHAQWRLLLETFPDRYAWWESEEAKTRDLLGKDVTILRDRRGGTSKPLTLRDFRLRVTADRSDCDGDDWGACGCFMDEAEIPVVPTEASRVDVMTSSGWTLVESL